MKLSRRVPEPQPLNAWSRLLAGRRAAGAELMDLTEANPTRVGLSGAGPAEVVALASRDAARYQPDPRGAVTAREAVAGYYAARGLAADPAAIVLTSGTSESYAHLFRLLADPGACFLVPAPSYPLFEPLAALEGVRLRTYRIAWDGRWHLDAGSLEAAFAADVRGVIVVQPNHPTGSCLDAAEIAALEALCRRHDAAIIADEVFGDFPWTDASRAGLPSLLGNRAVPTFVLSGLSKVCGMPQLKLGWIAVAGPAEARAEALRGLDWIADLFLSVGTPVQNALPKLLKAREDWQTKVRRRILSNLARVRQAIAGNPAIELRAGAGGWVAVLRVPAVRGEEEWALELLKHDVVVHPGHFYDLDDEPHLIVSLIVPADTFSLGMEIIEDLASS